VFNLTDPTASLHLNTTEIAGTVHNCFLEHGYASPMIHTGAPARIVIYDLGDPREPPTLDGDDDGYETYRDVPDSEYVTGRSWMQANARDDLDGTTMHDIHVSEDPGASYRGSPTGTRRRGRRRLGRAQPGRGRALRRGRRRLRC
jgi:hypothetical protein